MITREDLENVQIGDIINNDYLLEDYVITLIIERKVKEDGYYWLRCKSVSLMSGMEYVANIRDAWNSYNIIKGSNNGFIEHNEQDN